MTKAKEATAPNPFLDARSEWNERYGSHIKQAHAWRAIAFLFGGVALVACGGLAYSAGQNHIVPYVVEVDKLHAVLPIGPADQAAVADARVIQASLMFWVEQIRGVSPDAAAENAMIMRGYGMIDRNSAAFTTVNDFMKANDPFKRAQTETVSVEVESVLPAGGNAWRVEWRETTRTREGQTVETTNWQANVTTTLNPPKQEAGVSSNPLGIYVTSVSWAKRL